MPQTKPPTSAKSATSKAQPSENFVDIQSIQLPQRQQPRRYFDPGKMTQLVTSIEEHGILEPLIVRPLKNGKFELVAGERRLRSAQELGLTEVPVVVRDFSDQKAYEVALLENLQRDDLNAIDETEGILHLLCQALDCSQEDAIGLLNLAANAKRRGVNLTADKQDQMEQVEQLFQRVGRLTPESFRTNRLPLLNMEDDVLQVLREGEIEYTKAKAISKLKEVGQRRALMREAIAQDWSLTQIKSRIKELEKKSTTTNKPSTEKPEIPTGNQLEVSSGKAETPMGRKLQNELGVASNLKSTAWDDPNKQETLSKILTELKALLQN
jgi:ParB family transcriptional regulator, chromosome partitioning protein